jgi:crossover junction endodeoxyribonuclease RuvC
MMIGIDPGLSGALAVLTGDGVLVTVSDTPVLTLSTSRGTRQAYDVPGMVALLAPYGGPGTHVIIEEAQSMPGQGVRSMFTTGYGYGLWTGVIVALHLPHSSVRPHTWKTALGLGKDKEHARLRAQQLYPGADLRRKRDHGRAEALLLAWYGWQRLRIPTGAYRCVPSSQG